ncbi:hypothetical protein B5F07_11165 [Lachnoclostridium sp. An169]|uniref:sensor histidine kinase n=1 Tax=Lachnoclostridium sp. An169 TaxID=1965569 RepID=UPI000B3A66F6|nr:HAMP domain-containing sensor histidine kinase [Lachnoclostridium sp. An169]OUP83235.1 hypothetical protein B5F07_11165 [Lachnoclostridium sp. An169]HJA67801.1 HAMP domain-containing histidine kinase [Candidatus Mediterraneibacter cottocaccae]
MDTKRFFRLFLLIAAAVLASAGLFFFLYRFDNKYTTSRFSPQEHLSFDEEISDFSSVVWLTGGWEFYPGMTAQPEELSDCTPESVYIGQYFSFADFNEDASPYGTSTYRLTLDADAGTYALYLPEIFSACRVYVNGELVGTAGSFAPHQPGIKDLILPVDTDGRIELVIQVMNYSHYYSGITYPPALGTVEGISHLITARMLFYGFLCFTSLALAVFSSAVWFGLKKERQMPQDLWLGILALSFSVRICYPFFHIFGISWSRLQYTLEDVMSALGILCIVRITCILCCRKDSTFARVLTGLASGFVLLGLMNNLLFLTYIPRFVPVYGVLLFWYKLGGSLLLLGMIVRSIVLSPEKILRTGSSAFSGDSFPSGSSFLPGGLAAYTVSLAAHAICLGRFEPARFGWFDEWGTYILILCFSMQMVIRSTATVRENHYLNRHLQEEVNRKTASLEKLLSQRRQLLSAFAHDIKTPMTSITTFTRLVELDNADLDAESRQYLDTIREKTGEMQDRLEALQDYFRQDTGASCFTTVDLCRLIDDFCRANAPDMDVMGIHLESELPILRPVLVQGNRDRLMSVLQNLVYNAASFIEKEGNIRLTLTRDNRNGAAILHVKDNGRGIAAEHLSHIFDRFFTRRDDNSGSGLGLFIVRAAVEEHGGEISVKSEIGKGTCFEIRLPLMKMP